MSILRSIRKDMEDGNRKGSSEDREKGLKGKDIDSNDDDKSQLKTNEDIKLKNNLFKDMVKSIDSKDDTLKEDMPNKNEVEGSTLKDKEYNIPIKRSTPDRERKNAGESGGDVGKNFGEKMKRVFNDNLPTLSGYINKPFVYIPEDFYFLYSKDKIYFGDNNTGAPMGTQLSELLVEVITDILGFNNILMSVGNRNDMSWNYRQIINHKVTQLGNIYVQNVLNYHGKTFGINNIISVKTLKRILKHHKESLLPPILLNMSVFESYKDIVKEVDKKFDRALGDFEYPLTVKMEVHNKGVYHEYFITTNLKDLKEEYYQERLIRYQKYYEGKSDTIDQPTEGQRQRESTVDDNMQDHELEKTIDDSINKFNKIIGDKFSLERGTPKGTLIEIKKRPTDEWKSRLKEWIDYYKPKKVNSYFNPNKKLLYTGMILSSPTEVKGSKDMKGINIYVDTSTSINIDKVNKSLQALSSILETYRGPVKIRTFTTEVRDSSITLSKIRTGRIRLDLGGGTDIQVVLNHIKGARLREHINIIITDGEINWNDVTVMKKDNYRLAFLITNPIDMKELPKGKNIKIYEII